MSNLIDVCYDCDSYEQIAPEDFVLSYLDAVLKAVDLKDVEFSVSFIDEGHMHDMNLGYRNIDDSTDFLCLIPLTMQLLSFLSPVGIPWVQEHRRQHRHP